MANSADPDQLASSEANWSGSTLFAKQGISGFSRTRVKLILHETICCGYSLVADLTVVTKLGYFDLHNKATAPSMFHFFITGTA